MHHQAVARLWAVVATSLADATLLPFDIENYATFLNQSLTGLEEKYGIWLKENNATLSIGVKYIIKIFMVVKIPYFKRIL